jgi:hypothetical protein
LLDLILDSDINPILLSSFVGALSLFGQNLEKIEEINIKGLDLNMIIVYKYNLIFIAIMAKSFTIQDIRNEAELALDLFYSSYIDILSANTDECIEVSQFTEFKKILYGQIIDYFKKVKDLERKNEIGNFGFFTEAIKRLREVQGKNI